METEASPRSLPEHGRLERTSADCRAPRTKLETTSNQRLGQTRTVVAAFTDNWSNGFEYYRHGTLSLFAALNKRSGEVLGQIVPRHTSAAFVEFLAEIVASQPKRRAIHVIATISRRTRPRPSAPSCSSTQTWRCTSRRPIRPGSTKSSFGLRRSNATCWRAASLPPSPTSPARFVAIHRDNKTPKPIRWAYRNPAHRISSTSVSTVH